MTKKLMVELHLLEPRPGVADHQGEASGTGRIEVVPGDLQVELVGVVGAYPFGGGCLTAVCGAGVPVCAAADICRLPKKNAGCLERLELKQRCTS